MLSKFGSPDHLVRVIEPTDDQRNENESITVTEFLGSGSYLMFPWVGRLESTTFKFEGGTFDIEPVFKDQNDLPIHGLYVSMARRVIAKGPSFVKMEPISIDPRFPSFTETFRFNTNLQLEITLEVSFCELILVK